MQLPHSENSNSNVMQPIRLLEGVLFSPAYRADPNKNQKALSEKSLCYLKSAKSSQIPEKREEKSHQDLRRKKLSGNVATTRLEPRIAQIVEESVLCILSCVYLILFSPF